MNANQSVRPILVVGSPRSGTTLIGNYIGSADRVLFLGEYIGYYHSLKRLPEMYWRIPSPFNGRYIDQVQQHALGFPYVVAREINASFTCDASPFNILLARRISELLPEAIFVLILRNYRGVLQSLERSYNDGYQWAGSTIEKRAELWASYYEHADELERNRTIAMSYDELCKRPARALKDFQNRLNLLTGITSAELDLGALCHSHATNPTHLRQTIGARNAAGKVRFVPIREDQGYWTSERLSQIAHIVQPVQDALVGSFPQYEEFIK